MKKSILSVFICIAICLSVTAAFAADTGLPAFPGAEGGGKYSRGARANDTVEVYHVTNLDADGAGSFKDAVSRPGRIIVFDVGGTIHIDETLRIENSNLTILGQTAPGDGITIAGHDLSFSSGVSNVILRYIRVRPTDANGGEPDGIGGRWCSNIIVDHCSTSWGVDELLTVYAGYSKEGAERGHNITVQNCISSESLRMSSHVKGAHGYGAIFGAGSSTWHHNLLAHHDSRSPRVDQSARGADIRNNVIYNWGQINSAYGGQSSETDGVTQVNWVNNYYKFGPATGDGLKNRIFQISNNSDAPDMKSEFYFDGNYMDGDDSVTADNSLGVASQENGVLKDTPFDMGEYSLPEQSAAEAYGEVLSSAGATLPRRDAIDARIVQDVINRTGRIINNADEVGGVIDFEPAYRIFEIPQEWKDQNGMGGAAETDIVPDGANAGYTWIEAYVNDFTAAQSKPTNPIVTVSRPATQTMDAVKNGGTWLVTDGAFNYQASARAPIGSKTWITKIELYDGAELIRTAEAANMINADLTLSPGTHFLTSRAYNNKGEATQSDTSIVYVKSRNTNTGFEYARIGDTAYDGMAGATLDDGVYTVWGSGAIGGAVDSCSYMYRRVSGDFDITVKPENIPKFENGELSGIMLRSSLEPNSVMVMLADGWEKYGENTKILVRDQTGTEARKLWFKDADGVEYSNQCKLQGEDGKSIGYDTSKDIFRIPAYLRLSRRGDTVTLSVSDGGTDFCDNPRQPQTVTIRGLARELYIGIAADAAQGVPRIEHLAEAKYSGVEINKIIK